MSNPFVMFGSYFGARPALPAPEKTERQKLAEHFRAAVFGHTFRTLSFVESEGVNVHLRAVAMGRPDAWRVMRVAEGSLLSENGFAPGEQSNPVRDSMTLFEAADYLATFEKAQAGDGVEISGPDKAALGVDHYEAFCRREGMAIDLLGLPHPTIHGEIVTGGKFPPGEADAVRKAFAEREKQNLKFEIVFPAAIILNSVERDMGTPDIVRWEEDLKKRESIVSEAYAVMLYLALLIAFDFGDKKISPRFFKKSPIKDMLVSWGFDKDDLLYAKYLAPFRNPEYIHKEAVKYFKKNEEGYKSDIVYAAQYYYSLARAHHLYSRRSPTEGISGANASSFINAVEKAKDMLRKTGAADEDVLHVDYLVTQPQAGEFPKALLGKIGDAWKSLAEERKRLNQSKKSYVTRFQAPYPVVALPAPKT